MGTRREERRVPGWLLTGEGRVATCKAVGVDEVGYVVAETRAMGLKKKGPMTNQRNAWYCGCVNRARRFSHTDPAQRPHMCTPLSPKGISANSECSFHKTTYFHTPTPTCRRVGGTCTYTPATPAVCSLPHASKIRSVRKLAWDRGVSTHLFHMHIHHTSPCFVPVLSRARACSHSGLHESTERCEIAVEEQR